MKRTNRILILATSLLLPATALAQADDATRVANGTKATPCDVPPVVYVKGCTGTLVHPEVVVYAAHCGKASSVVFGESKSGKSVATKKCGTNPKFSFSPPTSHYDWAYCVLERPITEIPVIPIAYGCEKEMFTKRGQEVVQIGYGETGSKDPGIKYWGASELSGVRSGTVTVNDANGVVACPGDSGGPLMVKGDDGAWRTVGILSTYNGRCGTGGMNTYADIEDAVPWLEKESGYDLTPCFDIEGNWEPGPDCGGFYAGTPGSPEGDWGNMCKGTQISGRSTTCGENGGEDPEPSPGEGSDDPSGEPSQEPEPSEEPEPSGTDKPPATNQPPESQEPSEQPTPSEKSEQPVPSDSSKSGPATAEPSKKTPKPPVSKDSDKGSSDNGAPEDTGSKSNGNEPSGDGGSSGCDVGSAAPAWSWGALGLFLLGLGRRRK